MLFENSGFIWTTAIIKAFVVIVLKFIINFPAIVDFNFLIIRFNYLILTFTIKNGTHYYFGCCQLFGLALKSIAGNC